MASYQSAALRASPGYGTRPSSTPAYAPNYPSTPSLPTMPALAQDATLPGYVGRNLISQQLAQLAPQRNAQFTFARAGLKQNLAGYGGYTIAEDDPNTEQREDLLVGFDPRKGPGEREKGAIRGARDNANASGMLESSFANQNIASASQRVSLEAQAIINQYAQQINSIATDFSSQGASLISQFAGLYGSDAAWAVEHPPPTQPSDIPNAPAVFADDPANWTPAQAAAAPPIQHMTYADFLRGRKSTSALAHAWDQQFNFGRRFG